MACRTLQDDVGGLEIAVDDAPLVRGLECQRDLPGDRECFGDRQRPALQALGERRAFDELEHQGGDPGRLLEPVDRADVRMIERGQRSRFPRKTAAAFGITGEPRGQDLDRHVPPELRIVGAIDLSHAAGAERRQDGVGPQVPPPHIGRDADRRAFEKLHRRVLESEQRHDFLPHVFVAVARGDQERVALVTRTAGNGVKDVRNSFPLSALHRFRLRTTTSTNPGEGPSD